MWRSTAKHQAVLRESYGRVRYRNDQVGKVKDNTKDLQSQLSCDHWGSQILGCKPGSMHELDPEAYTFVANIQIVLYVGPRQVVWVLFLNPLPVFGSCSTNWVALSVSVGDDTPSPTKAWCSGKILMCLWSQWYSFSSQGEGSWKRGRAVEDGTWMKGGGYWDVN